MKLIVLGIISVLLFSGLVYAVEEHQKDLLQERLNNALANESLKDIVMVCNDINMQRIYAEKQYSNCINDRRTNYVLKGGCRGNIVEVPIIPEAKKGAISDYWHQSCSITNLWCSGADINRDGIVDVLDLTSCALTPNCN